MKKQTGQSYFHPGLHIYTVYAFWFKAYSMTILSLHCSSNTKPTQWGLQMNSAQGDFRGIWIFFVLINVHSTLKLKTSTVPRVVFLQAICSD